jgi:hypothetical protein
MKNLPNRLAASGHVAEPVPGGFIEAITTRRGSDAPPPARVRRYDVRRCAAYQPVCFATLPSLNCTLH